MEADDLTDPNPAAVASDPDLTAWFASRFPGGPTPIQRAAWPIVRENRNALLIAPTGTGKTLAGFLVAIDRMLRQSVDSPLADAVRCVYVSPLRSLANDVRKNLSAMTADVARRKGHAESVIRIGVRTGDTPASERSKLRRHVPHVLVTTPESLSVLLSQPFWNEALGRVETVIVDELHALACKRRGADLALSLERLASLGRNDPVRIGLSATCRPADRLARFLVGPERTCAIVDIGTIDPNPSGDRTKLTVESLIAPDEYPYRPLVLQRIVDRLRAVREEFRTTVVFANTRPMTERITYLIRHSDADDGVGEDSSHTAIAAHHGSLDASVRTNVEESLKNGTLGMVVTSTSLELGVDFPSADYVVQIGSPGSVTRCLQRLGRAGHSPDRERHGVILAAHPAELAIAVITADESIQGQIEPIEMPDQPLDVLCQHLVGQACAGLTSIESFFETTRRAWPFRELSIDDYQACLDYLCGESGLSLATTGGEPGNLRWTPPRLVRDHDGFRLRRLRIARWYRMNVGTIDSGDSVPVIMDGRRVGSLEAAYADRLEPGDRFVLDGRSLAVRRMEEGIVQVRECPGESHIPIWSSQLCGLSEPLARKVCRFRETLANHVGTSVEKAVLWLCQRYAMREADAQCLVELWLRQLKVSEIPAENSCLVESFPEAAGWSYAVHATLHRPASECIGRAFAARIGRLVGRDLTLNVSDFGFIVRTEAELLDRSTLLAAFDESGLEDDVIDGLDRGDLVARQFRQTAATGLMVLRNTETKKPRVGGLDWVSRRLYPTLLEQDPDHPLMRQARADVLERILDFPAVRRWLGGKPAFRFRRLDRMSPFTSAWLDPYREQTSDTMFFESSDDALQRLHDRLFPTSCRKIQA